MTRFILSIILFVSAGGALAQAAQPRQSDALHASANTAAPAPSSADAQPKIVQATLVLQTNGQTMRGAGIPPIAQDSTAAAPAAAEEDHPTMLMLLAALALMMGIALRRWSLGDQ